jgi:hypothetical protein
MYVHVFIYNDNAGAAAAVVGPRRGMGFVKFTRRNP